MLVANRTVPHYHPVTSPMNGLGVPAGAMDALKDEIGDPSEILGLTDADVEVIVDVEYIQCNLGTRTIDAEGKARPIFQAHAQLSGRDLLVALIDCIAKLRKHWAMYIEAQKHVALQD